MYVERDGPPLPPTSITSDFSVTIYRFNLVPDSPSLSTRLPRLRYNGYKSTQSMQSSKQQINPTTGVLNNFPLTPDIEYVTLLPGHILFAVLTCTTIRASLRTSSLPIILLHHPPTYPLVNPLITVKYLDISLLTRWLYESVLFLFSTLST